MVPRDTTPERGLGQGTSPLAQWVHPSKLSAAAAAGEGLVGALGPCQWVAAQCRNRDPVGTFGCPWTCGLEWLVFCKIVIVLITENRQFLKAAEGSGIQNSFGNSFD